MFIFLIMYNLCFRKIEITITFYFFKLHKEQKHDFFVFVFVFVCLFVCFVLFLEKFATSCTEDCFAFTIVSKVLMP